MNSECGSSTTDSLCVVSSSSASSRKRSCSDAVTNEGKKRSVSYSTYVKWRREFDKECQTISWLDCNVTGKGKMTVDRLKCKVCLKYKSRIESKRNYSDKWLVGAESVRTSNIRDHARSDQHLYAMSLHYKESLLSFANAGEPSSSNICTMLQTLSEDNMDRLRKKFDIAYFVANSKLAFSKYAAICKLETRHGVDIGTSYVNENAGKTFCKYIAEARITDLRKTVTNAKFFSVLMDGSTDVGKIDDELFLVQWCDIDATDEKIHSRMEYFTVARPESGDAKGLFECLQGALQIFGVSALNVENCRMLVGIGTDGASVNIAAAGLKGLVEGELQWIFWMWCLAHRQELALKDALKGTVFDLVDDMLTRLYYVYEKSPKKCRELEEVIADLRQCIEFDDAGVRPLRASGSRWVSHKLNAMKRVLSKFGAYTNHLTALSMDSSVKAVDRAKLQGYLRKWVDAKYLLGCAFFIDLLSPCAIFSKVMQEDDLDVLGAFTSLLRTVKEVNKLSSKPLEQWRTYYATLKKLSDDNSYQCQELRNLSQAKSFYESKHDEFCTSVTSCMKGRLAWSDLRVIRDVISVLATQGWQKSLDEEDCESDIDDAEKMDPLEPIERLGVQFKIPLESAGVDISKLRDEFHDMMLYATQFISLATLDYRAVWWRLFHSPSSSSWPNMLALSRLLFSLPVSNGKLERIFSVLKLIKVDRRSSLGNDTLKDLLTLNTDGRSMENFSPDPCIDLWWQAKTRRPDQKKRKVYKKRAEETIESETDSSSDDDDTFLLDDWDNWLDDN